MSSICRQSSFHTARQPFCFAYKLSAKRAFVKWLVAAQRHAASENWQVRGAAYNKKAVLGGWHVSGASALPLYGEPCGFLKRYTAKRTAAGQQAVQA
jgi:hypothetical protein